MNSIATALGNGRNSNILKNVAEVKLLHQYQEPVKGIMKVRTLEDSLRCKTFQRRSFVEGMSEDISCFVSFKRGQNNTRRDIWGKPLLAASFSGPSQETPLPIRRLSLQHSHIFSKRIVDFGIIEVREYGTTLGDSPGGKDGAPLTLDWKYTTARDVPRTVDEYELRRPPAKKKEELRLPPYQRKQILLAQGATLREIMKAVKTVEQARIQRLESIRRYKNDMAKFKQLNKIKQFFSCLNFKQKKTKSPRK